MNSWLNSDTFRHRKDQDDDEMAYYKMTVFLHFGVVFTARAFETRHCQEGSEARESSRGLFRLNKCQGKINSI